MLSLFTLKAYAAVVTSPAFDSLFSRILSLIVSPIVYLIGAISVVYFIWGVIIFIQNSDNAEKRKGGYSHMLYGIIGLFIMISATGIINIILSTLGL